MYTLTLEKRKKSFRTLDIALLFIALFWIARGKFFFASLLIIVAMVGFYINRKRIVVVSEANISYPYFIDKKIDWKEVSNIILKDDIITIDLKNNKLLNDYYIPNTLGIGGGTIYKEYKKEYEYFAVNKNSGLKNTFKKKKEEFVVRTLQHTDNEEADATANLMLDYQSLIPDQCFCALETNEQLAEYLAMLFAKLGKKY